MLTLSIPDSRSTAGILCCTLLLWMRSKDRSYFPKMWGLRVLLEVLGRQTWKSDRYTSAPRCYSGNGKPGTKRAYLLRTFVRGKVPVRKLSVGCDVVVVLRRIRLRTYVKIGVFRERRSSLTVCSKSSKADPEEWSRRIIRLAQKLPEFFAKS